MKTIKDVRIEKNIPYPYTGIETVELNLGLEKPYIVVLSLLPHSKASGEKGKGLQYYPSADYFSVRVSLEGGFTRTEKQCVVNKFVPLNSSVAPGPILQGTRGYLKVNPDQLDLVQEVFDREDYLGVKGWSNNVFVGVDKKGELMIVMNIFDRKDIQLVAVPGTNTIDPMPIGDKRTNGYKQHMSGVKSPPPTRVEKYTKYVSDMPVEYEHQPGDKLAF